MLLSVQEVKEIFVIPTAEHDHILAADLLAAIKEAENYCDTILESSTVTEYHSGDGSQELLLKNFPVTAITSIHDDVDREYGAASLIADEDYTFERSGIVTLDDDTFEVGKQNVKVVYTAGHPVPFPNDIKKAVANLTMATYLEGNGAVNAIQGQDFIYKPKKLRDEAYVILDRYKKVR